MLHNIASYLSLYTFPTGRRLYAVQTVRARAEARGLTQVAAHAAVAEAHERQTLTMELQRQAVTARRYGASAQELDGQLDQSVSGLDMYLEGQARLFTDATERGRAAALLRRTLLPGGAAAVTSLSYVQQCTAIDVLLARLQDPALAPALATMSDLAPAIEQVRALNAQYRASIDGYDRGMPTMEQLRAAQARGQALLSEVMVVILAHFATQAPDDHAGLADLLEPILRQNEAIRVARQRRRRPVDVNPDTGEEVGEGDGDIEDPAAEDPGVPTEPDVGAGPVLSAG